MRLVVEIFWVNKDIDVVEVIILLGVGEVLILVLDEKGMLMLVEIVLVYLFKS